MAIRQLQRTHHAKGGMKRGFLHRFSAIQFAANLSSYPSTGEIRPFLIMVLTSFFIFLIPFLGSSCECILLFVDVLSFTFVMNAFHMSLKPVSLAFSVFFISGYGHRYDYFMSSKLRVRPRIESFMLLLQRIMIVNSLLRDYHSR